MSIYDQRDPRFRALIHPNAGLHQIGSGFEWAEGPAWFPAAQMLLFSDIPAHRMMRWTAQTGCSIFREDSGYSNGNTRDPQGRLVTCHHGLRAVTRTEHEGGTAYTALPAPGGSVYSHLTAVQDGARTVAVAQADADGGVPADAEDRAASIVADVLAALDGEG